MTIRSRFRHQIPKTHFIFFDVIKCFNEQIGVIGLVDVNFYDKKYRLLNSAIYNMLVMIWKTYSEE